MNILLTLDYELYLGNDLGTASGCLLKPTQALISILDEFNVKATFFVDAGYLIKSLEIPSLLKERPLVIKQLQNLLDNGHDIQLHIHPHWEDALVQNNQVVLSSHRYRLHEFEADNIDSIVNRYSQILKDEFNISPIAYRAGGWSLQPFEKLANALYQSGIRIDSSVFAGGFDQSGTQQYDYRHCPEQDHWLFETDPLVIEEKGRFIELPIASCRLSPFFFWKFALSKKFGGIEYDNFGDGQPVPASKLTLMKMLTSHTQSVVSIDGLKADLLISIYEQWRKKRSDMVIMGHPKAFSPYSLQSLRKFLQNCSNEDRFVTMTNWYNEH